MGRLLFFAFLAIPLIEIALFILIGQAIGLWPTLLGVIVIAIIGSAIIRWQGLSLLRDIRTSFSRGQLPARALADAMLVTIAGVLMVVPGYFTDFVGLLLLIPALRGLIYRLVRSRFAAVATPVPEAGNRGAAPASIGTTETIELDTEDYRQR